MEDNKPLETDPEVQEGDATPTPEAGGEKDVKGFKDTLEEISGRKFESEEDAIKHYENLKSFVGKKQDEVKEEKPKKEKKEVEEKTDESIGMIKSIQERLDKQDFLAAHPDVGDHYDNLIKPLAQAKNIPLADALAELQPLLEAQKNSEEEKEIGITSKNRIRPATNTDLKALQERAMSGDAAAQEELIMQTIGKEL